MWFHNAPIAEEYISDTPHHQWEAGITEPAIMARHILRITNVVQLLEFLSVVRSALLHSL